MKTKTIAMWIAFIAILAISTTLTISYVYSQQYVQDSKSTATTGIFFTNTLNLEEYKLVASGNGWLGSYSRYSRSDRHTDVLTVYCKDYCKD